MIFSKVEVDKHLAKEELYFQRTKNQLSYLLKVVDDIEKDLRLLERAAQIGIRTEKINKTNQELKLKEEKLKTGLSMVLQYAGEEFTEKEELPFILIDILRLTVSTIENLQFGSNSVLRVAKEDQPLTDVIGSNEATIRTIKERLNTLFHLFNSAEELTLTESKVLFRQNLGNKYFAEVIPKWVNVLTKEFVPSGFTVELYVKTEVEEFRFSIPPLTRHIEAGKILDIHKLVLSLERKIGRIILGDKNKSVIYTISIEYNSPRDSFVVKTMSFSKPKILFSTYLQPDGEFISLDTFFDELVSYKELIISKAHDERIVLKDDSAKIWSALRNGIAP